MDYRRRARRITMGMSGVSEAAKAGPFGGVQPKMAMVFRSVRQLAAVSLYMAVAFYAYHPFHLELPRDIICHKKYHDCI